MSIADKKKNKKAEIANDVLGNVFFGLKKKKMSGKKSLIVNYKTQIEPPNVFRVSHPLKNSLLTSL